MTDPLEIFQSQKQQAITQIAELAELAAIYDDEYDKHKKLAADYDIKRTEAKERLAELMLQSGLESVKLDNGLAPRVKTSRKFFIQAGIDPEFIHAWLRGVGLGDIIKPTVHFQTMQAALTAYVDGGGQIDEQLINAKETPSVTLGGKTQFLLKKGIQSSE